MEETTISNTTSLLRAKSLYHHNCLCICDQNSERDGYGYETSCLAYPLYLFSLEWCLMRGNH